MNKRTNALATKKAYHKPTVTSKELTVSAATGAQQVGQQGGSVGQQQMQQQMQQIDDGSSGQSSQ